MKIKIAIVALFLACTFSYTQITCPTYTNDNVKKTEITEKEV